MIEEKSFQYVLNYKNNMLVVSLQGDLTVAMLPTLESLRQEILKNSEAQCVVLFFQEVGSISSDAIPLLAQIQKEIRVKPAELRLCALAPPLRERLVRMGVIRGPEVTDDLKAALHSFCGKVAV